MRSWRSSTSHPPAPGHEPVRSGSTGRRVRAALVALAAAGAWAAATAQADVFNGRLAFTSFRVVPPGGDVSGGDIFSMNADGTDVRRLSTSPEPDRQPDWSPSGFAAAAGAP
jgi:hypothetical protein